MQPGFCDITTCHGLADLNRAPSAKTRLCWLAILILTLSILIFFIFKVIYEYSVASVVTSISVVDSSSMQLPEVSICYNLAFDPVKAESIGLPPEVTFNLLKHFQVANLVKPVPRNQTEFGAKLENFVNLNFEGKFDLLMRNISFTCQDLLVAAFSRFNNFDGNLETVCNYVRYIAHAQHGYCFILPAITQVWPGSVAGWNLLLAIPVYPEKYSEIQYVSGFSIALGSEMVGPWFNQFLIPENQHTSMLLQATLNTRINRLSWPRSSEQLCEDNKLNGNSLCHLKCWVGDSVRECGCVPFGLDDLIANTTICNPFHTRCKSKSFESCHKNCLPTCETWEYSTSTSYSTINRRAVLQDFVGDQTYPADRQLASVSIAYSDMKYGTIYQKEAFTFQMAVSNIGGQLGLWMGISIITIFQAINFGISRITAFKLRRFDFNFSLDQFEFV